MADSHSLDDSLTSDERAALAAWAEGEPSEGFADAVLAAWSLECEAPARGDEERVRESWRGRISGRGVIGLGAAFAAAAAVMLMVRVTPPGTGDAVAGSPGCEHAESVVERGDLRPSTPPAVLEPTPNPALADDALAVLARHCSPCHDGSDGDAKPGALEVFDVQRPWWPGMSDAQLKDMRVRVDESGAATDEERDSVAAFVDAQLSLRAHAG